MKAASGTDETKINMQTTDTLHRSADLRSGVNRLFIQITPARRAARLRARVPAMNRPLERGQPCPRVPPGGFVRTRLSMLLRRTASVPGAHKVPGVFPLIALVLLMAATPLLAATNDLTSLLQQGLFEEEANRNLDAAIANYQSLAAQFDKDRQIGRASCRERV